MLTIENELIKIGIKTDGAELCSYIDKSNNREVIWTGDPQFWKRHSPILFPLVGKINDGKFLHSGKWYNLSAHGFARDKVFSVIQHNTNSIILELLPDEETKKGYPFDFILQVELSLNQKELKTTYRVINPSDQKIYFCLGAHPGINVPMDASLKFTDYQLTFEKNEQSDRLLLNPEGFRTGLVEKDWLYGNTIPLKEELFKDDALIFDDLKSSSLCIESVKGGDKVKVGWHNYPDMGIWKSYNQSKFICIEPWNGMADEAGLQNDISQKKGIVCLHPKQEFEAYFTIENIIQK